MKKKLTLQTFKAAGWSLVLLLLITLLGSCADPNCIKGEGEVETRVLQLDPFDALQANGDFKIKIT
ncbi:hypothetical protein [Pontibacter harenae]|uniref:hypothetical protein n=1 Tax=Pontibacter harenae TaxID=2894083 RepID=UPI001E2BA6F8|nr:hypothetical protein [Pontibacter harenae]MCC9166340.1 hypothetical protein [Pontibacter harenae]